MQFHIDPRTAKAIKKHPHRAEDIIKSLSEKQVKCKQWLATELENLNLQLPPIVFIAGSWYGNVLVPLLQEFYPGMIRLHDIDEEALSITNSIYFNDDATVKVDHVDCTKEDYFGMVINTSAEHMPPLTIEPGTIVAVQSNNYREVEDHINCVDSAEELAEQYEIHNVMYSGKLEFENYTRFMVIGIK